VQLTVPREKVALGDTEPSPAVRENELNRAEYKKK
jgi:hypothetical protein